MDTKVTKPVRIGGFRPAVLWMTGISGAGKTSIAKELSAILTRFGCAALVLDGDSVRRGLCRDLGFSAADRNENCRRLAEVTRILFDLGFIVIVSAISPFQKDRTMVRSMFGPGEFLEVYVDTPLHIAEARDVKGLYKKARQGLISNFTGLSSPYEAPEAPDIHLKTQDKSLDETVATAIRCLSTLGIIWTVQGLKAISLANK